MLPLALPDGHTRLVCEIWANAYARALGSHDVTEAEVIADAALTRFRSKMSALTANPINDSSTQHIEPDLGAGPAEFHLDASDREELAIRGTDTDEALPRWMDEHLERVWGERRYLQYPEDD